VRLSESFQDATRPTLIVTGPPRDGTLLALEAPGAEKVLGASPDAHLRLEADNVDAIHARVRWDAARGVILTDVGSAAGTYVNGERVGAGHPLQNGDRVSLGPPGSKSSVKLLVRLPRDLATAAAAVPAPTEAPAIVIEDVAAVEPYVPPDAAPPAAEFVAPEPEPESKPTPAPATPAAAAPARPLPLVPPPGERKRPVAEHASEVPSIVTDTVRETPAVLRGAPAAARPRLRFPVPRLAIVALAALVAAGLGYFAFGRLRTPPPVVSSVLPPRVEPGQTVAIAGTGFGSSAEANTVRFGDQRGEVTAAADTQLSVTVPAALAAKQGVEIPVTVETRAGRSNALFLKVRRVPHPSRLEPEVALPGQEVVLAGDNLDGTPLTIQVGGEPAEVRSAQADAVRLVVPAIPVFEGRSVPVTLRVGTETGRPLTLLLGRLPLVTEVAPAAGQPGEAVVVRGRGFDPDLAGNVLTFGDEPALVLSASAGELKAVAPAASSSGLQTIVPVVVKAKGGTSSGSASFTLVRPSASLFLPRFFAAPVTSAPDQAFVSTLLGPVLLLSDREGAASVGDRAVRVAAALNGAFESASSRRVAFEAREAPAPAVALAGGGVIVTATPDDAAGYGRGPDPPMKGQRATPRGLAAFWAALLQDQLSLFVQHQRPSRVLELSPRGKTLVDLYAEAERRLGSAGGVPAALVNPLSSVQARAFREMALVLPAGPSSAAAAVTGRWEGMMDETGSGERPIRVRLRLDGGRLAGSLATRAGELAMEVPLESLSYDKGVLSFVLTSGGAPRTFRGTLQGSTISGTIQRDKETVGRFSLRYAE
jgi:FHA domain-containing protein/IPT/TIG domain-containing protein